MNVYIVWFTPDYAYDEDCVGSYPAVQKIFAKREDAERFASDSYDYDVESFTVE